MCLFLSWPPRRRNFPEIRGFSQRGWRTEALWGETPPVPEIQAFIWVHANGGITNGGVACVCAKWRVLVHFCTFLRFSVRFFLPKLTAEKCKFAHNRAKNMRKKKKKKKKRLYAIPLVIPPSACHRFIFPDAGARASAFTSMLLASASWFKPSVSPMCSKTLDGPNRQSPIASVQRMRPTLADHSAVPRGTNTTPMIARFESRRNERRVYKNQILCF